MIPILYPANETRFTSNGIGRLSDAITCTVTEEKNGIFELNMTYPLDGIHVDDIEVNKIIYARPSIGKNPQPFRIRDINRSWGSRIQIVARHFYYELSYYPCPEFGKSHTKPYKQAPILYDSGRTVIGVLSAGVTPTVVKSGSTYTLTMTYPASGPYYSEINSTCYIYYQPEIGKSNVLFDITRVAASGTSKVITATASTSSDIDPELNEMNVVNALGRISSSAASLGTFPFTMTVSPQTIGDEWATTTQEFWNEAPVSVKEMLLEGDGKIIDTFGGEWEWDHYTCILHEYRGKDTGVIYTYGKNITDINSKINIDEIYTHAIAYWKGSKSSSTNTEDGEYYVKRTSAIKIMDDEYNDIFPIQKTAIIDASSDFDEEPSTDELKDYINWYVEQNKINVPEISTTINIVDLASTEEYKDFAPLETVQLCDSVSIIFPLFGVHAKEEVTKIEFNVLTEKNNSVTIGETKMTLANAIANNRFNIRKNKYDVQSWADRMAERATRASNGWYGGNIKKRYNSSDHKQQDLLIMDEDSEGAAGHVLKADGSGISGSTSGSNGTYDAIIALRNPRNQIGVNATAVNFGKVKTQDSVAANKQSSWDLDTGEAYMFLRRLGVSDNDSITMNDFIEGIIAIIRGVLRVSDTILLGPNKMDVLEMLEDVDGLAQRVTDIEGSLDRMRDRISALQGGE